MRRATTRLQTTSWALSQLPVGMSAGIRRLAVGRGLTGWGECAEALVRFLRGSLRGSLREVHSEVTPTFAQTFAQRFTQAFS